MPVRVGFVGTGGRAADEMHDILLMEDAEIAALCDVAPGRCEEALAECNRFAQEHGRSAIAVPCFADVAAMLSAVDLDAVYVSVPTFAHGAIEHAILDAGRHLLVEKPIAIDMSVAREVADHARRAGVVTCVGYQLRYATTTLQAREWLSGHTIGMATAMRFGGLPGTPWWRVQRQSGGMLVEQHTHAIDLLRFLIGDVARVYAEADTRLLTDVPNLDIADVNVATLRFTNGAVAAIGNSPALRRGMRMPGELSGIHVLADGLTVSLHAASVVSATRPGADRQEVREEGNCNRALNDAFIHAVRTGDRSRILSDYDDAVKSFEITHACVVSAARQSVVRLGADV